MHKSLGEPESSFHDRGSSLFAKRSASLTASRLGDEGKKAELDGREDTTSIRMKDENGFYVDIVAAPGIERDMMTIRMNVDDFDEAKKLLESHGFTASSQGNAADSSSKSIGMYSPSGFSFSLVEHIKH